MRTPAHRSMPWTSPWFFGGLGLIAPALAIGQLQMGPAQSDQVPIPARGELALRQGTVPVAELPNELLGGAWNAGRNEPRLLVLDGPMTPARRSQLQSLGVRTLAYIPRDTLLVDLGPSTREQIAALPYVRAVASLKPEWKIAPETRAALDRPEDGLEDGLISLAITLHPFRDTGELLALIDPPFAGGALAEPAEPGAALAQGGRVLGVEQVGDAAVVYASVPAEMINVMAALASVGVIEPLGLFTPRDTNQRWIVQTNTPGSTPVYARGITGQGHIVGVIDGWASINHCALIDEANPPGPAHRKIVAYNTTPSYDLHGTHVAGIVIGDAGQNDDLRGVAYGARMAFNVWPSASEPSFLQRYTLHASQGAFIHTNSWGNDNTTAYDYACRALDTFQWEDEEQLILFAASNRSTLRNPENAKNVLSVGATGTAPSQHTLCFGGTGPTIDGRRKPDAWAPGCTIASASGSTGCGLRLLSGTSMATPALAGAAILAREYFTDGFYPTGLPRASDAFSPSGSLLKAMLANTGQDLEPAGFPGVREGWGRVRLDDGLFFDGDTRRLIVRDVRRTDPGALETGASGSLLFRVRSTSEPLRVTLVYADAPANALAAFTPVNDLDLTVFNEQGQDYLGNNFAEGFSSRGGNPDPLNNLEQVHLATPQAGVWSVQVRGTAVNQGPQGFAVVVTGDVVPCIADFDSSGGIDLFDYLDYVAAFSSDDPSADLDGSGTVDFFDYLTFAEAFGAGC
ncbi:MAG: S8 family serine peptidase [Planctomycetota bacterium]|nr:S8 family serine peptidase [Planctomycetota bacterium]